MKNIWHIVLSILVFFILLILVFEFNILTFEKIYKILKSELAWTIIGVLLATVISIWTHCSILKSEKRVATIEFLSKIRIKYPNLKSKKTANCTSEEELAEIRKAYLNEMEFLCVGIRKGVFDLKIVDEMSGHLLVRQYKEYMKTMVENFSEEEWKYSSYKEIMEKLTQIVGKKHN